VALVGYQSQTWVKDTPIEAGASALGCIGRRTGSWVRPRPLRKSLGSKACSDFVGVSGISLGLLVVWLMVVEVGGNLDVYLQSLSSWFKATTDNGYILANRALPHPLPFAKSCIIFHVGILDATVEVQLTRLPNFRIFLAIADNAVVQPRSQSTMLYLIGANSAILMLQTGCSRSLDSMQRACLHAQCLSTHSGVHHQTPPSTALPRLLPLLSGYAFRSPSKPRSSSSIVSLGCSTPHTPSL